MAGHELIEDYVRALRAQLPATVVDELTDGLIDGYEDQLTRLDDPEAAARAAIADFGDVDTVTAAFVRASPGRGAALYLLATGPPVGLTWATTLVVGHTWAWHIPHATWALLGTLIVLVVLTLGVAVRERHHYLTVRRAALAAAAGLIVTDATMLTTVVLLVGSTWATLPALIASAIRATLTARALPGLFQT